MSLVRLPKLILETPSKTIPRFLESCKPLLSAQQFQATESIANIFLKSTSSVLQERLLQLNNSETSWLENIWLEKNYLSTRSPLPVNCNFWVCFNDHPKHDRLIVKKTPPPGVYTDFQVSRAACIVSNLLDFKDMIHQLPQDYQNDSPLCMSQYNSIFGSSRVPGVEIDTITKNPNSNHIIILLKNQIYKLDTLSSDGSRVPLKELERQIYAACRDSLSSQSEPPINFFTAGERLEWAKAYQLLSRDDLNQSNLKDIQDSAFILCLDDHAQTQKSDKTHRQYFHNENGSNRWFDKPLSIIVASNGRAGANCEHSLIDASVVSNILDYCIERYF